jgi:hypothetical protein
VNDWDEVPPDAPETPVADPLRCPRGYDDIKQLARHFQCPITEILALSTHHDPFYAGQPGRRTKAGWFAQIWQQVALATAHLRRIHYRLVSLDPPILKPDGMPYANTERDWILLQEASKAARCLGLVPADAISDARNPDAWVPMGFYDHRARPQPEVTWDAPQLYWALPAMPSFSPRFWTPLPTPMLTGYDYNDAAQPFHIEIWIEKSTMNDILEPLAHELFFVLSPAVGFTSITRTLDVLKRIAEAGKPTRIFYISDYDPAGQHMAPSVARQLEFWLERYAPGAEVKLQRLVLTRDQVAHYTLPRIPIKDSDARKAHFEAQHGEGAVELDALEAVVPGELERIIREALAPYRDPDLAAAYGARDRQTRREVARAWHNHSATVRENLRTLQDDVTTVLEHFEAEYEDLRERQAQALAPYQDRLHDLAATARALVQTFDPSLPACPASGRTPPEEPHWLFDSQRDYLTQMAYYRMQGQAEAEENQDA